VPGAKRKEKIKPWSSSHELGATLLALASLLFVPYF
jgi:hypothetical protein